MLVKTGLNGGDSYETSTPHESGKDAEEERRMQFIQTHHSSNE